MITVTVVYGPGYVVDVVDLDKEPATPLAWAWLDEEIHELIKRGFRMQAQAELGPASTE